MELTWTSRKHHMPKDPEAYRLAEAIAQITRESMTRVVTDALRKRFELLESRNQKASVEELLAVAAGGREARPSRIPSQPRSLGGQESPHEIFDHRPTLSYVRYRSALNRCWAALSLLWIAWCLCWPFYARHQDMRTIQAEAAESYNLCLHQKGMTAAGCAVDRNAYTEFTERLAWPPEQSPYQSFAGKRLADQLSFLTVLCLLPVITGYVPLRAVLEVFLWFARAKPQDLAVRS